MQNNAIFFVVLIPTPHRCSFIRRFLAFLKWEYFVVHAEYKTRSGKDGTVVMTMVWVWGLQNGIFPRCFVSLHATNNYNQLKKSTVQKCERREKVSKCVRFSLIFFHSSLEFENISLEYTVREIEIEKEKERESIGSANENSHD